MPSSFGSLVRDTKPRADERRLTIAIAAGIAGFALMLAMIAPAGAQSWPSKPLCNAAMTSEAARAFLKKLATDPYPGSPESLALLLESEIAKWGRIIKSAGMEPD